MTTPISRRALLGGLGALGLSATGFSRRAPLGRVAREHAPNVLFLMPDQLRRQSTSFHGDEVVLMPAIEKLAGQSLVFDRAISTNPVCSAYRTMMLTGEYTHRTRNKLRPEYDTLYKILNRSGWEVAHIGKWHMTPKGLETESGYVPPEIRAGVDHAAMYEAVHEYRHGNWFLNDDPEPRDGGAWRPDTITELAVEYLRSRKDSDDPFFLTLAMGPPHQPYQPSKRFDLFSAEEVELRDNIPTRHRRLARSLIAKYYGMVACVEETVERVLRALDESGRAGNTLVIFSSDHGDMLWSQGEEFKRRPWEESIGVPLTIRPCKGIELATGRRDDLVGTIDLMPTLLDLLGLPLPERMQGRSIFSSERPQAVYLQETSGSKTPFDAPWRGVLTDDGWKYVTSRKREHWLLYDLNADPLEQTNLVNDSGHGERREDLAALLREMAKANGDPFFPA